MPKLLLIDGHALAYRAFYATAHAGNVMATSKGELTNAVYVFVGKLLKIWQEQQPDYMAVAFDVGRSFRHDQYPDYKANRAKTPDELHYQVERIRQAIAAFNIPIFTCEGYEADDVLGTLSRQAAGQAVDALILTGDTDILQLVDDHTHVLLAQGRSGDEKLYGPPELAERYGGLSAAQLIDLKALVGDTSDNIPGVRGIGEKTALALLRQYGSVEGIYDHLDEIKGKRERNALEGQRAHALACKGLVTIRLDAPVELNLEQARAGYFDRNQVAALFRELEFHSLASRIPASHLPADDELFPAEQLPAQEVHYEVVDTPERLAALKAALQGATAIAFDTETTSTRPMEASLVGISLCTAPGQAWYIPVGHERSQQAAPAAPSDLAGLPLFADRSPPADQPGQGEPQPQLPLALVVEALKPILESTDVVKYAHNASYDIAVLAQTASIEVCGPLFDTMVAAWVIEPSRALGLKALAADLLGADMTPISDLIGTGKARITMDRVPVAQAAPYACADADMTFRLAGVLAGELHEKKGWALFSEIEMPLVPILTHMEMAGIRLDVGYLARMSGELEAEQKRVEAAIYRAAGRAFNINSTKQLSDVLFEELRLPRQGIRKTTHGYSTAADVLELLKDKHPVANLILEQRQIAKLKSTYVDALPALVNRRTGRLHTSYNQTGAVTGRLSSSDPNLQNIPIRTEMGRQIRRAFVAEPGWVLLAADYSQIELRVLAHISQDAELLDAFARDQDIHARTAAAVYGVPLDQVTKEQRRIAKTVNFGLIYGQSAYGLSQQTGLDFDEAERFIATYFQRYPGVQKWLDKTRQQAYSQGYVETLKGRRRYFPELQSTQQAFAGQRAAAERQAINAPIQGTAADILKIAMIELDRRLKEGRLGARMVLQVHDELVLEVPRAEVDGVRALVRQVMEGAFSLCVPLKVDVEVGENWLDMQPA